MSRNPYGLPKRLKEAFTRPVPSPSAQSLRQPLLKPALGPPPGRRGPSGASPLEPVDEAAALLVEGRTHHRAGRLGEAERIYRRILASNPEEAAALHLLGMVGLQSGRAEAAIPLIRQAIASAAASDALLPEYFSDLGIALQSQGLLNEAVEAYQKAIAIDPAYAAAWSNRGLALEFLGRLAEAASSLERAAELKPGLAVVHSNLGNVRKAQGLLPEAEAHYRRALVIDPCYAEGWSNLAGTLELAGRFAEAMSCYERALNLKPEFVAARCNRAMLRLLHGDFAGGLPEYELRRDGKAQRRFSQPQWRGEPLAGARILLHAEQGLGDSLQFLRYLPRVQAAGGKVVLEIPAALRRLAQELDGIEAENLIVAGEPLPDFDLHSPLMSLPLALGTTPESLPRQVPYLRVPVDATRAAASQPWPDAGLRVGLVWAGSASHLRDRYRSIPLAVLKPILDAFCDEKRANLFSLQLGPEASKLDDASFAGSNSAGLRIVNLSPHIQDMADTAALIASLDLVIAADTAVAHLAGALGKPVWVLLPMAPDWRWMLEREDSPWYPTMRLFRQKTFEDWAEVVERVRAALETEILAK